MAKNAFVHHPIHSFLQFLPGSLSFILVLLADAFIQNRFIQLHHSVKLNYAFAYGIAIIGVVSFLLFIWGMRFRIEGIMHSSQWWVFSVLGGFVLGGALGNIIDFNEYGFVVDYWHISQLTWFNLSDIAIMLGIFGIWYEFSIRKNSART